MNFLTADVAVVVDKSKLPAQLASIKSSVTRTVNKIKSSFRKMGTAFKMVFNKMVRDYLVPLWSKMRELDKKDYSSYHGIVNWEKSFYYLGIVRNYKKIRSKANKGRNHIPLDKTIWYTKKEIDLFPRYCRRGGEYGHDTNRVYTSDEIYYGHIYNLCKVHDLEIIKKEKK